MRLAWKFLIILGIVLLLSIIPNLLLIRSEVIGWFPLPVWTLLSVLRFLALTGIILLALYGWVIRPLGRMRQSLAERDPGKVASLTQRRDEMGSMARLIRSFFSQQSELNAMVEEKNQALINLSEAEARCRHLLETIPDTDLRREAGEAVGLLVERQQELIRLKSDFISLVSHEFRTPLTTISSNVQLLERYESIWSPEKKAEVIRRVRVAIGQLISLLEELSLMARDPNRMWQPNHLKNSDQTLISPETTKT